MPAFFQLKSLRVGKCTNPCQCRWVFTSKVSKTLSMIFFLLFDLTFWAKRSKIGKRTVFLQVEFIPPTEGRFWPKYLPLPIGVFVFFAHNFFCDFHFTGYNFRDCRVPKYPCTHLFKSNILGKQVSWHTVMIWINAPPIKRPLEQTPPFSAMFLICAPSIKLPTE